MEGRELLKTAAAAAKDLVAKMIETGYFSNEPNAAEKIAAAYGTVFDAVLSCLVDADKRNWKGADLTAIEF